MSRDSTSFLCSEWHVLTALLSILPLAVIPNNYEKVLYQDLSPMRYFSFAQLNVSQSELASMYHRGSQRLKCH